MNPRNSNHIDNLPEVLYQVGSESQALQVITLLEANPMPDFATGENDSFSTSRRKPVVTEDLLPHLQQLGLDIPEAKHYKHATELGITVLHLRAACNDPVAQSRLFIEHLGLFVYLATQTFGTPYCIPTDTIRSTIYDGFMQCINSTRIDRINIANSKSVNQLMFNAINWSMSREKRRKRKELEVLETKEPLLYFSTADNIDPAVTFQLREYSIATLARMNKTLARIRNPKVREAVKQKLLNPALSYTDLVAVAGVSSNFIRVKHLEVLASLNGYINSIGVSEFLNQI